MDPSPFLRKAWSAKFITYNCTSSTVDRTLRTRVLASLSRLTRCQRLDAFEPAVLRRVMFNLSFSTPDTLLGTHSNSRCFLRSNRLGLNHRSSIILSRDMSRPNFILRHTRLQTPLEPSRISVILNMTRREVVSSNAPSRWQRVKRPSQTNSRVRNG
jgi:hypothetical protein